MNRIEITEIDPHKQNQVIFDKGAMIIQRRKDSLFVRVCWNNWTSILKINLGTDYIPFTKINFKWLIGLNVKFKVINVLEYNTSESLGDLGFGDDFKNMSKAQSMKEKLGSWTSLKLKISAVKDTIKKMKRRATDWEPIFTKQIKDMYP